MGTNIKYIRTDYIDEWIRMIALNRLTGHSSGFFSVYTMPPNQAVSADSQRKINEKRKQTPQPRNVDELIIKKSKTLLSDGAMKIDNFRFGSSPVNETKFINDNEVDLIVTSPPFLDVVDYKTDNWMRCRFAGIDPDKIKISEHRSVIEAILSKAQEAVSLGKLEDPDVLNQIINIGERKGVGKTRVRRQRGRLDGLGGRPATKNPGNIGRSITKGISFKNRK